MGRTLVPGPVGAAAVAVGATSIDVLLSIGVFVGVPAIVFVVLVLRELRRLRRRRSEWRAEDAAMHEEGFPPGAPVAPTTDSGEVLELRTSLRWRHRAGQHRSRPR
jgi:H+/gluconate symporter-like permease